MARKPRIHIPGGVYHVMLRGNSGQDIFIDNRDRNQFYRLLQDGLSRFGHRIHGYCLMANHVHLAVQVGEKPLSKIMQNLSFRYTSWFNRKHSRFGHLFQGRYKAILVEQDNYLLELVCYIHLNPVRAKIVRQPAAYPWSGHRTYLGKDSVPWLHTEWVLSQFGKRLTNCRKRYSEFVQAGRGDGYREEFHVGGKDQRLLGEDRFVEKILGKEGVQTHNKIQLNDLIRSVCSEYQVKEEDLRSASRNRYASQARQVIGWLALKTNNITLTQVAHRFGRDVTTLSRGVRRTEESVQESKVFAKKLGKLYNTIIQA